MFCSKCGKEIQKEWTSCPNCGEPVNHADTTQQVNIKAPVKKKKSIFKRWWFWVIAVLLLFFIMIAFSGNGDETDKQTESVKKSEQSEAQKPETEQPESSGETAEYTVLELYKALEDNELAPFTINDKAEQFLEEHENYFPVTNYEHISASIDTSIEYKHIEKSPESYGDKLIEIQELYVMSIEETDIGDGNKFTEIETIDAEGDCYTILYNGVLENVFKDDVIKADILPFGTSAYDNVSGGVTRTLVGAGAYVEKLDEG